MKKMILLTFICFFVSLPAYSKQDSISSEKIIDEEVIKLENINEDTLIEESIKKENKKNLLDSDISKYYSLDKGILKLQLNEHLKFDFGAIGTVGWTIDQRTGNLNSNFKFNTTDFVLSGKINDNFDYKAQMFAERNINERTILGDLFIRGKYKNVTAQIGRMRKPFAYEPTFSLYDHDFATRSQIGRLFGDHRDTGGKVLFSSKYADLGLGMFAVMQDRPFYFGQKGFEFDSSLTLKPLAKFPEKGDLKIIGSIATGKRDRQYNNFSSVISYNYKKFGILSEFISKEATYNDEKKANGFYLKSTYFLNDKLQATLRFDTYNPDVKNNSRLSNEYTAGLNYYFNKKNTMLVLNYTFVDGKTNSHRISLQMRYRTW